MRLPLAPLLLGALSAGTPSHACTVRVDRSAEAAIDSVKRLIVRAGAGDLTVEGVSGQRTVSARGVACGSNERQVERLQVRISRERDALVLTTEIPEGINPFNWFGGDGWIDLGVTVPAGIAIDIEDSSGSARISKVGAARITDSSGELEIDNVRGDLTVGDGSGEIAIRNVQGLVRLADGSGDIAIEDVSGDVIVTSDGSGEIRIADVRGSVTIGDDGSGEISIQRVGGSVKIEQDGSGGILVQTVKHDVSILEDGAGEIEVIGVDGDFSVDQAGSGGIKHERVAGSVRLARDSDQAAEESNEQPEEDASDEQEVAESQLEEDQASQPDLQQQPVER